MLINVHRHIHIMIYIMIYEYRFTSDQIPKYACNLVATAVNGISHIGWAQQPCALPFPHCRDLRVYVMMRPRLKCSRKARMTRPASRKMARSIFIKRVLSTIMGSNLPPSHYWCHPLIVTLNNRWGGEGTFAPWLAAYLAARIFCGVNNCRHFLWFLQSRDGC